MSPNPSGVSAAHLSLEGCEGVCAEARAAIVDDDPAEAFLVLVWLPASMFFSRL